MPPAVQQSIAVLLIWIGLATVAGLIAKLLIPGHQPYGVLATLGFGICGSTAGLFVLATLRGGGDVNPLAFEGLAAAVAGAVVMLLGFRVVSAVRNRASTPPPNASE